MAPLVLVLKKIEREHITRYDIFNTHSREETINNESNTDDNVLKSICTSVILKVHKCLGNVSCCIIDSVMKYNMNIWQYNHLADCSYIKLTKELDHPRKGLINIQNMNDHEFLK